MRKTIIASNGYPLQVDAAAVKHAWLDLHTIAEVQISSEDVDYPVEGAFKTFGEASSGELKGWRAGAPGPQTLELRFDQPQSVKRVLLHFRDEEQERSQEFSLKATLAGGDTREIVRQQWSFSPGGSTEEQENYLVNLERVTALKLWIDPDRGRNRYPATLQAFGVEG